MHNSIILWVFPSRFKSLWKCLPLNIIFQNITLYYTNTFPHGWKINTSKYKLKCNWKPELLKMYFTYFIFLFLFYTTLQRVIIMPKIIYYSWTLYSQNYYWLISFPLLYTDVLYKCFFRIFKVFVIQYFIYNIYYVLNFWQLKKKKTYQIINYNRMWQCHLWSCGTINGLDLYSWAFSPKIAFFI